MYRVKVASARSMSALFQTSEMALSCSYLPLPAAGIGRGNQAEIMKIILRGQFQRRYSLCS